MTKTQERIVFPSQCKCGHIYLETYQFNEVTDEGYLGFCWCGFCRTKLMVKPLPVDKSSTRSADGS